MNPVIMSTLLFFVSLAITVPVVYTTYMKNTQLCDVLIPTEITVHSDYFVSFEPSPNDVNIFGEITTVIFDIPMNTPNKVDGFYVSCPFEPFDRALVHACENIDVLTITNQVVFLEHPYDLWTKTFYICLSVQLFIGLALIFSVISMDGFSGLTSRSRESPKIIEESPPAYM